MRERHFSDLDGFCVDRAGRDRLAGMRKLAVVGLLVMAACDTKQPQVSAPAVAASPDKLDAADEFAIGKAKRLLRDHLKTSAGIGYTTTRVVASDAHRVMVFLVAEVDGQPARGYLVAVHYEGHELRSDPATAVRACSNPPTEREINDAAAANRWPGATR